MDSTEINSSKNNTPDKVITTSDKLLWALTLFLGIGANILFYEKTLGISYPIFILMFYGVFLSTSKIKISMNFGWLLTIPVLSLSFTYLFFSNKILMVLNFMVIPVLLICQTLILTGCTQNKWFEPFFITDVLEAIFVRLFMFMGKPFSILAGFIKINPQKNKILFKIIAGMSISFPLVLIILVLLSSADGVFKYYLDNIPNLFNYMKIDELFWQTLFITVVFLASFSYLSSLMQNKSISSKPGYYLHKFLDPTIVSTVLVSVNIIYVFFVTIQFTYLLGGIKPQNLSFSEYARKGFFELVLVSIINLSILLFNINFTSNSGKISTIFNKISNSLLILCTLVMLYSAHYRMWLYEETYGYTYLRVFTHSFMIFIFITLIVTAIKVWNTELPLLKYYIIISIISYMAINFVNVDSIIAQKNIQRYQRGKDLDLSYFYVLSYDSVPYLESIINDENYSDRIKVFFKSKLMNLNERNDWQSFNLSAYVAKKIIEKY